MTLAHSQNAVNMYSCMHDDEKEVRPQLLSRHSSSLPVDHINNTKKKALSRRSRSASPCIKKYSAYSGNPTGLTQRECGSRNAFNTPKSPQLPVIRKPTNHLIMKNLKAPRHLASTKQRAQGLNDYKKSIHYKSVWENVSSVRGEVTFATDVNSNFSCLPSSKLLYGQSELSYPTTLTDTASSPSSSNSESAGTRRPFDLLPVECILKIFAYLNQMERGRCMFVCSKWHTMARTPIIWGHINFREFNLCYGHDASVRVPEYRVAESVVNEVVMMDARTQCSKLCYGKYKHRIERYILFLIDIQPKVWRLEFSFDLLKDDWLDKIKHFIRHTRLTDLEFLDVDWQDTPVKPHHLFSDSRYRLKDIMYETRRRHRNFANFLEELVETLPNTKSMIMPFHWSSEKAAKYVSSLHHLKNLVLKKSTVLQIPCQEVFDELGKLKYLEQLLIEVWLCSGTVEMYHIWSPTLKYLDLSQCTNFCLKSVDLPSLEVLVIGRPSAISANQTLRPRPVPCFCNVIRRGAPMLQQINQHRLVDISVDKVLSLLKSVCSLCRQQQLSV